MKQYTVAIAGLGGRGLHTYAKYQEKFPERMKITAIADIDGRKVNYAKEKYNVPEERCFDSAESLLAREKLADVLIIATQDRQHRDHAVKALELGYDLLLEKPVAVTASDCIEIREAAHRAGRTVTVCHVLQYTAFFRKIREIIRSGVIGEPVTVNATENVGYWHQAHSFVRGNWRSREETAPMILAKCCHDLDLLQFFAKSKCKSISSVGDLTYFKPENAPEGSAERCLDCACADDCPYNAKRIYTALWEEEGRPDMMWPHCQLTTEFPLNEAVIERALRNGPYGRCVFRCDNDVVDHQITQIAFENGVKASLTMTAFNAEIGRTIKFMGTLGEIVLNEEDDFVAVKPFGKPQERFGIKALIKGGYGHGGGDAGLVEKLYDVLSGKAENATSLEASVESHLMAICAERSRLEGGRLIYVHGE